MNEELNKELCELLGICWHEPAKDIMENGFWKYFCFCRVCFERKGGRKIHIEESNPDFISDSGKIALLREMRKRGWRIGNMKVMFPFWTYDGEAKYTIDIDYLLDDTGKLAIEARDFLKGERENEDKMPKMRQRTSN